MLQVILSQDQLSELANMIADRIKGDAKQPSEQVPAMVDRHGIASAVGVSIAQVDRLDRNAVIPSHTVGTRRLFVVADVLEAIKNKNSA